MRYDDRISNDSDPDYAPGLQTVGGKHYWRPTRKYVAMGYPGKAVRLPDGDHLHRLRAAECRRLTRAMLRHFGDGDTDPGTWAWVMDRWKSDPYGNYATCKANTRAGYDFLLQRWEQAIGHMKIADLTYDQIGIVRSGMARKGRSDSYIRRMFSLLRTQARYAQGPLRQKDARDVVDALGTMRFKSPPKRQVAPTPEQIRAIIDEADARGLFAFATGLLFQWTYMLRAVDVRGQWLEAPQSEGGIWKDGLRWQDGLTWDMFDADLTVFEKVISKTARALPEPYRFRLTPELRGRLTLMRGKGPKTGPVIVGERTGQPYTIYGWSQAFRRIRTALDLPDDLTMMDTRAGAITDAKTLVDPMALRDAAGHLHTSTTDGYARARSENANKVVELRTRR